MPVQVSYPGVYIQEVPSGVHTITGVSTSIAAFIGRASKGKMNRATRILSLSDYIRAFGEPHPMSDLANSVKLFFANGGSECYVIRIAKNARSSSVTLRSLAGQDVLVATAKAEGVWGDTVRLEVDYKTPNADDTFNLRVIYEDKGVAVSTETFSNLSMNPGAPRYAPGFVTQSSELIDLKATAGLTADAADVTKSIAGFSFGRMPLGGTPGLVKTFLDALVYAPVAADIKSQFDISVNGSQFVTVQLRQMPPGFPTTLAQIRTAIKNSITAALSGLSPAPSVEVSLGTVGTLNNVLTITAANGDFSSVRVKSAASNDIAAALMLGLDNGGVEAARWSNFRPAPTGAFLPLGNLVAGVSPNPGTFDLATSLNVFTDLLQSDITSITIDGVTIPLNAAPNNLVTTAAGDNWFKSAGGGNDGVREKLNIIASAINNQPGLAWRAEVSGYHLTIISRGGNINQQPTISFGGTAPAPANLLALFKTNVRQYSLGTGGTGNFSTAGVGGFDGDFPTAAEYLGNPVDQTGFYALDPVDLFNLMVIPADQEVTEAVQLTLWGPASIYCAARRAFLLIDAPPSWTAQPGATNPLPRPVIVQNTGKVDSDVRSKVVKINSAVFYPRLIFNNLGINKPIGAAGAIAGLMARIDSSRGVWKAPAGTEADLRGIVGLEVNLTDLENGVLNKVGVNCERAFPSGFVNWGARTMDGSDDFGSEWKYIPIRRLALFLEESLFRGTKWIVFEPNDEPLWANVRLNLNAFMMSLFRQGAFQGSTPDKAYYVKCDGETTTQNDRNLGIVNIEVGFAPLKPAEFVIIKIQQIAGEL